MKDPRYELMEAAKAAVDTALSNGGYSITLVTNRAPGQTLPAVIMDAPLVLPRHTKTTEGSTTYLQYTCWADTFTAAVNLANTVMQAVTDRDSPITPSTQNLITTELDESNVVLEEDTPSGRIYGIPIRVQYRTAE